MDTSEKLTIAAGILILISMPIVLCYFPKAGCEEKSISFEDHRYSVLAGCMVKHDGKWLPLENIRGFD